MSRICSCSATTPAQVPRFVMARASQNEKKRQPGGPITARRADESALSIADPSYASPRAAAPGRSAGSSRHRDRAGDGTDILARDERDPGRRAAHARRGRARRARRRARRGARRRPRSRPGRARRGRARGRGRRRRLRRHDRRRRAQARARRRRRDGRLQPPAAARPPHGDRARTPRATSCARPWCGSRTASRRAPRACGPSCWRASSTRSTPARRRACARSAPRARAISGRSPTSPTGSAATCPWPPRRASR